MSDTPGTSGDSTVVRKVILTHKGGSRAGQKDELPVRHHAEITIGRDPSSVVRFAPDTDDLVSRNHAKISQDRSDPSRFLLTDLGSRNGTFVNRQRISHTVAIHVGDVIQLGAGGPELLFDLEPRPPSGMRATRLADSPPVPPTRLGGATSRTPGEAARPPVGRETVERMISSSQRRSRAIAVNIAALLLVVVAAVAAWLLLRQGTVQRQVGEIRRSADEVRQAQQNQPLPAREIAKRYGTSSVLIEFSWKLEHAPSGAQLYQRYVQGMPAYLRTSDGIEPWLITDSEGGSNKAIFADGSGSGFVVTSNGFILTNRHVAENWQSSYQLPLPGKLYQHTGDGYEELGEIGEADAPYLARWAPAKARYVDGQMSGTAVEARLNYLDVTFPKTRLRIPGRLVRVSDRADVALIKIDLPTDVPPVELFDSSRVAEPGDEVTILGYPEVSPNVAVRVRRSDPSSLRDEWQEVPDPTVTAGHIGRVIRAQTRTGSEAAYESWSEVGNVFQLDVNATGAGTSGGPIFDGRGRVIGILTSARQADVRISLAIPIRYGMELMGITPVTQ